MLYNRQELDTRKENLPTQTFFFFHAIMKTKRFTAGASALFLVLGLFALPTGALAGGGGGCEDKDQDGYYIQECPDRLDYEGTEIAVCDCVNLTPGSGCATDDELLTIFSKLDQASGKRGRQFNPGVPDIPSNGIDEDCTAGDTQVAGQGALSLGDLIQTGISFLSAIVAGVSTLVLIWAAIMYATAAGEEEKTRKARKAMIGAVVGLIVGLLAPQLIGMITDQFL